MLDFDFSRAPSPPKLAATVLMARDSEGYLELFCVERHPKSGFFAGAIVFPGGKLDASDGDPVWDRTATPLQLGPATRDGRAPAFDNLTEVRPFAVASLREALEEAALLPVVRASGRGGNGAVLDDAGVATLRAALVAEPHAFARLLQERGLLLDLAALRPFGRWVTPVAESRRFDTRFFITRAPDRQSGAHDDHETTASFWARPRDVLARFDEGTVKLAPPTHRCLTLLAETESVSDAFALAATLDLSPICPKLVRHLDGTSETIALLLPGDPDHDEARAIVPGPSRFVLRGDRWLPENAPAATTATTAPAR